MTQAPGHHPAHHREWSSLRLIAALLVMADHFHVPVAGGFPAGVIAVRMFFVMSGVHVMRRVMEWSERPAHDAPVGVFLLGRVSRLLPVLALAVGLGWLVDPTVRAADVPWHLMFASNLLGVVRGEWPGACSHLWSVSVQMQFYVLGPVLLLAVPARWRGWSLGAVLLGAAACRGMVLAGGGEPWVRWLTLPACADAFAAGAWFARYEAGTDPAREWSRVRTVSFAALAAALLGLAVIVRSGAWPPGVGACLESLECGAILAGLACLRWGRCGLVRRALLWRPLVAGGAMTYSLYALHPAVGAAMERLWPGATTGASPLAMGGVWLAAGAVAWVSWRVMERRSVGKSLAAGLQRLLTGRPADWFPRMAVAVVLTMQLVAWMTLHPAWQGSGPDPDVESAVSPTMLVMADDGADDGSWDTGPGDDPGEETGPDYDPLADDSFSG